MSEVTLMIHGRTYGVGCDEGQEKRVRELGQYIDRRVKEIASAGGAATEAHLLALTALVLADELFEAREQGAAHGARTQINQLSEENESLQAAVADLQGQLQAWQNQPPRVERVVEKVIEKIEVPGQGLDEETELKIAVAIENISNRLSGITKRLQAA